MPKQMEKDADNLAFAGRLIALLEANGQPRRGAGAYLSRKYKVATVTANAWLNGEHRMAIELARQIADEHHSSFDELYFGSSSPTPPDPGQVPVPGLTPIRVWETEDDLPADQYVLVPTLKLALAAGNGKKAVSVDYGHPKAFLSNWLRDKGLSAKYLVSMKVSGDSMAPWVNDGDTVVIDRADIEIIDGRDYAIRYGDELRIKQLHRRFDGGLILRSLNTAYADEIIAPVDLEHVEVLGRVVWRAG